jgi:predicted dehydrogenase
VLSIEGAKKIFCERHDCILDVFRWLAGQDSSKQVLASFVATELLDGDNKYRCHSTTMLYFRYQQENILRTGSGTCWNKRSRRSWRQFSIVTTSIAALSTTASFVSRRHHSGATGFCTMHPHFKRFDFSVHVGADLTGVVTPFPKTADHQSLHARSAAPS